MEEQKPKDLLEKEIKEEIKEEPLDEDNLRKVVEEQKLEYFFEREIKEEIDDFSEKIKEEPLDEEYFQEIVDPYLQSNSNFFDMPNDEISNSSSQIIKQEPVCSEPRSVVSMDDVKMESIDELDYDLGSQMHLNHEIMEKPKRKLPLRCCSICYQLKPYKIIKVVDLVRDKLIIMVKLVLCGEYNLSDAQSFVYRKKREYICYAHYSEAFNVFCSVLRIQKLEEINSCSPELMQNLMRTVNALWPRLLASGFRNILNNFTISNKNGLQMEMEKHEKRERQNRISKENKNRGKTWQDQRCSVCSQMKSQNELRKVASETNKFMCMIGCILRGAYTIEEAQSFMSKKQPRLICHSHFPEAINEFFNVLRIQKLEEIHSCPSELMQNLMVTVNAIFPQLTTSDFCRNLSYFIRRHLNSFRMVHLERKHGIEKLLNHNSNENKNRSETGTSKTKNHHCSVCAQLKPTIELRKAKTVERKMMIMIGCILRGEYTIEEAHTFIYGINECFVCRIHFSQAIDEIYKALKIKNYDEFVMGSDEMMKNLMIIVNDLIPQFETWQFQNSFEKFLKIRRNVVRID